MLTDVDDEKFDALDQQLVQPRDRNYAPLGLMAEGFEITKHSDGAVTLTIRAD